MSEKETAIRAIEMLPDGSSLVDIMREVAFLTGVEDARAEIRDGEGMSAEEAKGKLREWLTG
jgi:hypothetical protein